jgi:CRP-like cAMP-binding protein
MTPDPLRGIPFLRDLDDDDRSRVAALASEKTYPAGTVIFAEGSSDDNLHVLARGLVSFRVKQEDGGESTMGTASEPGDLFGIAAVVGQDHTSPYTAVCLEDTDVLELAGAAFRKLCEDQPAVGNRILTHLIITMARRLNGAREQLRSRVRPGLISHG